MDQLQGMTGPDFLHSIAQQERANGNDVNACYFEERARQWRREQRELEAARGEVQNLTDRLSHIAEHAQRTTAAGVTGRTA